MLALLKKGRWSRRVKRRDVRKEMIIAELSYSDVDRMSTLGKFPRLRSTSRVPLYYVTMKRLARRPMYRKCNEIDIGRDNLPISMHQYYCTMNSTKNHIRVRWTKKRARLIWGSPISQSSLSL